MHWRSNIHRSVAIALGCVATAGCHHSAGDNTIVATPATSAVGVWTGTDSASGRALTAIVNSAGQADFIRADGVQYVGTVPVPGISLTIPVAGFAQFGTPFADASTYGTGTVTASITTTISATLSFTSSAGTASTSSWMLSPNAIYNTGSSLTTVSGNYSDSQTSDPSYGATVSISTGGVITAQSATTGCVLNGQIAADNTGYDIYEVSYSYSSCTGGDAALNGVLFTGLAVLFSYNSVSPSQLVMGVTGADSSGVNYGLVTTLTLQ